MSVYQEEITRTARMTRTADSGGLRGMSRRLWLEPAGNLPGEQTANWQLSAYRVRSLPKGLTVFIAEDGTTGRWGIVRGLSQQWSGDFPTVEDALASLEDELSAEGGKGA